MRRALGLFALLACARCAPAPPPAPTPTPAVADTPGIRSEKRVPWIAGALGGIDAYDPTGRLLWSRPYRLVHELVPCAEQSVCATVDIEKDTSLVRLDAEGRVWWSVSLGPGDAGRAVSILDAGRNVALLRCSSGEISLHAQSTGAVVGTSKLDHAALGDEDPQFFACALSPKGAVAAGVGFRTVVFGRAGEVRRAISFRGSRVTPLDTDRRSIAIHGLDGMLHIDLDTTTVTKRAFPNGTVDTLIPVGPSAPGSVYALTREGTVQRARADGSLEWSSPAPFGRGELAIGADGTLAAFDQSGAATMFSPGGAPLWAYVGDDPSGGILPIVAAPPDWAVPLSAADLVTGDVHATVTLEAEGETVGVFARGDDAWAVRAMPDRLGVGLSHPTQRAGRDENAPLVHRVAGRWIESPPLTLTVAGFPVDFAQWSLAVDEDGSAWMTFVCEIPVITYGDAGVRAPPTARAIIGRTKLWHLVGEGWVDASADLPEAPSGSGWVLMPAVPLTLCAASLGVPPPTSCIERRAGVWRPVEVISPGTDESVQKLWSVGSDRWLATSARLSRSRGDAPFDLAPDSPRSIRSLWSSAETSVWAAGGRRLWRWDGSGWRWGIAPVEREIWQLTGSGDDDVWAITETEMLHFDGRSWQRVDTGDRARWPRSIASAGRNAIWVPNGQGLWRVSLEGAVTSRD